MKTNIVIFYTDDHGHWASGCYGNSEIQSPSIDYLAKTGVRFKHAFTPSPVCSPSRASFWTGKIPSAHGVHDHIGFREHPGITGQVNLGQLLQKQGYNTAMVGKWHCHAHGDIKREGFNFWYSQWGGTNSRIGPQDFSRNGIKEEFFGHQSVFLTDQAVNFIEEQSEDEPFFIYIGYTDTHSPFIDNPERLVDKYRQASFKDIPNETFADCHGTAAMHPSKDPKICHEKLAQYYAAVSMIDEQVGRVMDVLSNKQLLDNTVVIYTGDHGHMNGHHGLMTKGNATTPQNFLEESIHIPMIFSWPSHFPQGLVVEDAVDHCDLFSTLLDISNSDTPDDLNSPGRSFLPLLNAEDIKWRQYQFCEYGNARMIRDTKSKLILRYEGPNGLFSNEFYDLENDPRERVNQIENKDYNHIVLSLTKILNNYFKEYETAEFCGKFINQQQKCNPGQPWNRD